MATRRTGRGQEVAVIAPTHCPDGHPLRFPNVQAFTVRIAGRSVVCWRCWTCEAVITEDELG